MRKLISLDSFALHFLQFKLVACLTVIFFLVYLI